MSLDEIARRAAEYDPTLDAATLSTADAERDQLRERFPLSEWPQLPLERYALGQEDAEDTFCRWMEFVTTTLCSIKGGSARKLIIYKQRTGEGWHFDASTYPDVYAAWEAVRAAFVRAFTLARDGRYEEIDAIPELAGGQALLVKTLHVYFPDDLLPIASRTHLRHFLAELDQPEATDRTLGAVSLNRALLNAARRVAALESASTQAIATFLYRASRPPDAAPAVVKVSPGHDAMYWEQCRDGGYICIGWDELGDLRHYSTREDFDSAFAERFDYSTTRKRTEKSNEVWRFFNLREGDRVVANRGTSEVLAVGTVTAAGYEWLPNRPAHRHVVHVEWDETLAQRLDEPVRRWALVTVAELRGDLRRRVLAGHGQDLQSIEDVSERPEADTLMRDLEAALLRRGQAILYGPPGTGKTYVARRFAEWWLGPDDPGQRLTLVTFHPSYSYEDWVEGFRPSASPSGILELRLEDGVFKRICQAAREQPEERFLLVIDEINRANVAKVFGELITLIESDKRGVAVRLPQSKDPFDVPPNIFLLGTMNTADRSIALLDVALRRRFAFLEVPPRPDLLDEAINGVDLVSFLEELNARVARVAGAEKQVGHAYFMPGGRPVRDPDELAAVLRFEVIPLLDEYCFGEPDALRDILGDTLVDAETGVRQDVLADADLLAAVLREWPAAATT